MKRLCYVTIILMLTVTLISSCTRYETRIVPFKMPAAYHNVQNVDGAAVAAVAYADAKAAQEAFGFDIRGAGLLPVQVIFDNQGQKTLLIDPAHTYLIDKEHNLWPVMESKLAYERIEKKTEMAKIGAGAAKHGFLAGAAGALIGAAVGIVTGENVGEAIGKGAAVGAAAGATIGGAQAYSSRESYYQIRDDLENKSLQNSPVPAGQIAHGFIFFPGEAKSAQELRLQLEEIETGKVHTLVLPL